MTSSTTRHLVRGLYLAIAMSLSAGYVHAKTPAPVGYQAVTQAQIMQKPTAAEVLEIVFSPAQSSLYVSSPNWKDETLSRTLVLDPKTLEIKQEIPMEAKSFGVALDDAANRLFVNEEGVGLWAYAAQPEADVARQPVELAFAEADHTVRMALAIGLTAALLASALAVHLLQWILRKTPEDLLKLRKGG